MNESTLLDVVGLTTRFATERGEVTAVDEVSFHIDRGEIVGLVGESGCGKSVTASSIMRLLDERYTTYGGEVILGGTDLLALPERRMRKERGRTVSMVFQDPMTALNPVYTVENQLVEAIRAHRTLSRRRASELALQLLEQVGIPDARSRMRAYPHQLSGGMRQRVVIAMALSSQPQLLIADEPTTALDVTIQAQILELILALRTEYETGVVLITHDLGVVAQTCDRVLVMYLGQIIEDAPVDELFRQPHHPYTIGLLGATPSVTADTVDELQVIPGRVPSLHDVPVGCRFAARCTFATQQCLDDPPPLDDVDGVRKVRCWNYRTVIASQGAAHVA